MKLARRTSFERITVVYAPELDGDADPGEVVWAWIPYAEDTAVGKDRPVLVIGSEDGHLAVVPLTSSFRPGRYQLGRGDWDGRRSVSWVRVDDLYRIPGNEFRREGAVLERPRFDQLIAELRRRHEL
jgi:PemK-like, MazF-like toxin of type II toxin-antitoxin system